MLVNPSNPNYKQAETNDIQSAARVLGVRLLVLDAANPNEVTTAFRTIVEQQIGALLIGADVFFVTRHDQIVSLAARYAIPTMFFDSASVAAGGLVSYGPDLPDAFHQVGLYTGRVLKGEKPADLPVVQPTKFELVLNLKTAKALGLEVPPTLLALTDRVIE
jgi:putative ABC transport system substrate-binding protein